MACLLRAATNLEEEFRTDRELQEWILASRPMWLTINQFNERVFGILDGLPSEIHIYWKIEYMGESCSPFHVRATNPRSFVRRLLSCGHRVACYSFNEWNRDHILGELPDLNTVDFRIQPIAIKEASIGIDREKFRRSFGVDKDDLLMGVAGLYDEVKGIDELAGWLLSLPPEKNWKAIFSLITDLEPEEIQAGWRAQFGDAPCFWRIKIRKGDYRQWDWMAQFYRSVDVILVNSRSDSWGRVVTEPIGLGTPVLVRRAECGTNYALPGLTIVEDFSSMNFGKFMEAFDFARRRASRLLEYTRENYSREVVRETWIRNLRASTPLSQHAEFDRLVSNGALGDIEGLLEW